MAIDYAVLKTEIQTDPQGLGYASKQDNAIASLMNAPRTAKAGRIQPEEFILWAAQTGVAGTLEIAARGTDAAAKTAIAILWLLKLPSIDIGAPRVVPLLQSMVDTFGVTGAQRNALVATATTQISRAEVLFGQLVTDRDIAIAMGRV